MFFIICLFCVTGCGRDYDEPLKIAYVKAGVWQVFIMDEDGNGETQLTTHNSAEYPCFSADGDKILYIHMGANDAIDIIDLQGNLLSTFPLPGNNFSYTAWSPDGNVIATYQSNVVYLYRADGTLINTKQDGAQYQGGIGFYSNHEIIIGRNSTYCDLWNFKDDTISTINLTYSGANTHCAISSDRNEMLWYMSGPGNLYHTVFSTGVTVQLASGNMRSYPVWVHDGSGFFFLNSNDSGKLYFYSFRTGNDTKITDIQVLQPAFQYFPR